MQVQKPIIICLMGPTASGKTALGLQLVQQFPCDIISVDSAMIYRDMNIGTAKPDQSILQIAPHRLIDIRNPDEIYSAGQFRVDALHEIQAIIAKNRIPLLIGGTMLYFKVLQEGIAQLPTANVEMRNMLQEKINQQGLQALHTELKKIDPHAAARIHPNDSQRIQRALEVFYLTQKTITELHTEATHTLDAFNVIYLGLMPQHRVHLHERIATRFQQMLDAGFEDEMRKLLSTYHLTAELPSMRAVGYADMRQYVLNKISFGTMKAQAIAATRQLAKRQITWLRSWKNLHAFHCDDENIFEQVKQFLVSVLKNTNI